VRSKDTLRSSAEATEQAKALRKIVTEAEVEMKRLSHKRAEIDAKLSAPQSNGASIAELMKTRAEIERRLAAAEQNWLEVSEAAERSQR
jgi:ATP-binding cassette subfamily F protein 3